MKKFHREINKVFLQFRKKQILTIALSVLMVLSKFLLLMIMQKAVDSITGNKLEVTIGYLKESVLLMLAFFVINCIFQYFFRDLEYTCHYALVKSLFGKATDKEYIFHEKHSSTLLLSMIKEDSKFISDWKSIGLIAVISNAITLVIAFVILFYYNVLITVFILAIIITCFALTHYISKKIGNRTYDLQISNSEMNQKIMESFNGIKDIKQYGKEDFFKNQLDEFIDRDTYRHSKSISRLSAVFTSIYAVLTTALPILALIAGVLLILAEQFTIGQLITTYALIGNLQEPVLAIPEMLNQRRQALSIQEKIMPLLEKEDAVYSKHVLDKLQEFSMDSKEYEFEDGKKILKNLKIVIKKGSHILLKGESGKGKTSVLNLISRFYSTQGQAISMKYNGISIEDISTDSYYRHVIQEQQIPYIFQASLFDNIALGESYRKEDVKEILQVVCLEELVQEKGMDYRIEEKGENLSGGQRQRIGIARALIRKPDILMLDEPTSALNEELSKTLVKRVVEYCIENEIALITVSHSEVFEEYYETRGYEKVEKIILQ